MADLFISYRRGQDRHAAGRLHGELSKIFGRRRLFMDVDDIPAGMNFERHLQQEVGRAKILLAVIGPNWVNAMDTQGRRRLFQTDDFVRIEIAAALERKIRVVPVLIDGANMPGREQLPPSLQQLASHQAVWLRHDRFTSDVMDFAKSIKMDVGVGVYWRDLLNSIFMPRGSNVLAEEEAIQSAVQVSARDLTDVEKFVREKVVVQEGNTLSATILYEAYCDWCDSRGLEPLALPTFGREIAEHNVQKVKKKNGVYYVNISLRKNGLQQALGK